MNLARSAVVALAVALVAPGAQAQVAKSCDEPHALDKYQLLRRLSLDLRGRVPSYAEYRALDSVDTVPTATVAAYLASADYQRTMRRYHEDLFWPNVTDVDINFNAAAISSIVIKDKTTALSSMGSGRRKMWRGDSDASTTTNGRACGAFEQTHFDPKYPGQFRPDPAYIFTENQSGTVVKQEGYRKVHPYWAPTTTVNVCAFEAQETLVSDKNGTSCNSMEALNIPECGCGPGLRSCYGPKKNVANVILEAMREQLGRKVDEVTSGKPYTDLLLSTTTEVNGPLSWWKKYLGKLYALNQVYTPADDGEELADLDFTDQATWKPVDRKGLHAGVLTLPAYMLRFQTNRSRANRFRNNFECSPFVPPAEIETVADGCAESGTDLTARCTCRYCHRILEPLAAHWGQFSEAGTSFLNPTEYPRSKPGCVSGKPTNLCRRFYVTDSSADAPGSLLSYQYADAQHPAVAPALDGGPRKRVNEIIANGVFGKCTVKRLFANYVKRDMHVTGENLDELDTLNQLSADFATHGYDLKWLAQQIVELPQYRSLR